VSKAPVPLESLTGWVLVYSAAYRFQAGLVYKNGAVQPQQVRIQPNKAATTKPSGTPTTNYVAPICVTVTVCGYAGDTPSTCQTDTYCGGTGGDDGDNGGGGYGGGDGGSGGGGGSGGSGGNDSSPNPNDVYLFDGQKPLGEYPDKCAGVQGLWNLGVASGNVETAGVITADGKFLVVAVVGATGGGFGGLYHHDTGIGSGVDYYQWPSGQGAPTQTYQGQIQSGGHYFIPIVATVHTHTPCLADGTDGISGMTLSRGDQNLASSFPNISHYIIGCGALGSFSNASTSPSVLTTGQLSSTCSTL
jgi:hypothetical protein